MNITKKLIIITLLAAFLQSCTVIGTVADIVYDGDIRPGKGFSKIGSEIDKDIYYAIFNRGSCRPNEKMYCNAKADDCWCEVLVDDDEDED